MSVRLTDALLEAAEKLGDGSVSVGVRAAIELAGVTRPDGGRRKPSRIRGDVA